MTTLAITGSLGPFRTALKTPEGRIHAGVSAAATGHRPDLAASVAASCLQAGVAAADIDEIIVDVGPGSYTGLRVATTFANTCRAMAGVQVAALTSLEVAAAALTRPPARAAIVLDARRGRWHHGTLAIGETIERLGEPRAAPIDETIDALRRAIERDRSLAVIADTALHGTLTDALGERAHLRQIEPADGATLFDARLRPRQSDANLEPLYLMGSYAETPHGTEPQS